MSTDTTNGHTTDGQAKVVVGELQEALLQLFDMLDTLVGADKECVSDFVGTTLEGWKHGVLKARRIRWDG